MSLRLWIGVLLGAGLPVAAADANWWTELPAPGMVLELPLDLDRAAAQGWDVVKGPALSVVTDAVPGRPVIQNVGTMNQVSVFRSREAIAGAFVLEADVRINQEKSNHDSVSLLLLPGAGPATAPPLIRFYADTMPAAEPYLLRLESPVGLHWLRLSPDLNRPLRESWFRLRLVRQADKLLFYKDGYLAGQGAVPAAAAGSVRVAVQLAGTVQLASCAVRRLQPVPAAYCEVPLDSLCNARALGEAGCFRFREEALPVSGRTVMVGNLPFRFPERTRGDHIDLAASEFQLANAVGGFEALTTWPGPATQTPGRLMLNVPPGPWRRLWLIAACDEREAHISRLTVRFFWPGFGPITDATAEVPSWASRKAPAPARRLGVTRLHGWNAALWLLPVELDPVKVQEAGGALELTKDVYPYRNYPDPCNYSYLQGGLPSSVRVFAMTLEAAPIGLTAGGNRRGQAYLSPEQPVWKIGLQNQRDTVTPVKASLTVTDPAGKVTTKTAELTAEPLKSVVWDVPLAPAMLGLHQVRTEAVVGDCRLVKEGTFVQLPPNTRQATAANSRWGLWSWNGGHNTNSNLEENLYLLKAAGTVVAPVDSTAKAPGMLPRPSFICREPLAWKEPLDPAEYQTRVESCGKSIQDYLKEHPGTRYLSLFSEKAISLLLTYSTPAEYVGEKQVITPEEKVAIRNYFLTAKAYSEGAHKYAPDVKILISWCEPIFTVPFLWEKYPRELLDGIGVDTPQFERMPEMPIRSVTPSRMWLLKDQLKKHGYEGVEVVHSESYFPSSHPLALGFRGSADSYVRTAVLSLAQGSTRLLFCFSLEDSGDYWGNQHYGCIGLIGRLPDMNPKPAFPAYATMTRLLDLVEFDGYVPTGSRSAYCVRFRDTTSKRLVYCLWTLRGERPAMLRFEREGRVVQVQESGNETPLASVHTISATADDLAVANAMKTAVVVRLTSTPFWIVAESAVTEVTLGESRYTERPGPHVKRLDALEKLWNYDPAPYPRYATNHWDLMRVPGPMQAEIVNLAERDAKVWRVTLQPPPVERKLAAWYGVFKPKKPLAIPGKAKALGIWANGKSNWGRIIYEIEDTKGEIWQSIGTKDDWNCDDTHSWSSFNFDGWRYLEFPLPAHLPYDNYRTADTVWWNYSAEGIVDLPVKLTRLIIELRTHNVYVSDLLEESDRSVQLADLLAVYDSPEDMTTAPVRLQREAARLRLKQTLAAGEAQNPIAERLAKGTTPAPAILTVVPPRDQNDGTRLHVTLAPVDKAAEYRVYVSGSRDGRGAKVMGKAKESTVPVTGLQPGVELFLFATAVDAQQNESKPSVPKSVTLRDEFPMK